MRVTEQQLWNWMVAGLGGDALAHRQLLAALLPMLRAFFRKRLHGQGDEIEDLVQEVLIAVHTRRVTYDPNRPFSGWMFGIARYKLADHFRARGRHVTIEGLEDILVAEGFEDAAIARADVGHLLGLIPAKQAAAIRATRIEGLSTAEAAEAQGIGESDVKVSVHRGMKALAARITGGRR